MAEVDFNPHQGRLAVGFRSAETGGRLFAGVSLRRFIASPVSFGLTLGLAIVALILENFQIEALPMPALVAWFGAIAASAVSLKIDWPLMHVIAAGLLLGATFFLLDTVLWPLALAGAVFATATARLAGLAFVSRQVARVLGLAALGGIGWLGYGYAQGALSLGLDDTSIVEIASSIGALVVIAVLAFWQGFGDDED